MALRGDDPLAASGVGTVVKVLVMIRICGRRNVYYSTIGVRRRTELATDPMPPWQASSPFTEGTGSVGSSARQWMTRKLGWVSRRVCRVACWDRGDANECTVIPMPCLQHCLHQVAGIKKETLSHRRQCAQTGGGTCPYHRNDMMGGILW
ncbi:hypothetical protein VDGL01_07560 [Verticillium dahliae]